MKLTSLLVLLVSLSALSQMPKWSYDAGPDLSTEMGRELVEITAAIPNFPLISNQIIGRKQKFRPAFGPIPWRMRQDENAVKILFVGQDGTHIAEAAGRPATAGFGGRAQDFAQYFGVNEGAAFINTYAFTIKGQYGVYGTPYIYKKDGKTEVKMSNFVDNKLWLISQNLESPIVKWRNQLIDWIIRNNKKSMKMIVLFGGAARDAIATYAESKGAKVNAYGESLMKYIQIPATKEEYAGGNNTFPSLVDVDGKDLYKKILEESGELDSSMVRKGRLDYSKSTVQKKSVALLKENVKKYINSMAFTKSGPFKNGLIHPAQIGGFNLGQMYVNGVNTRSLKGLTLDDGTEIENDILVVEFPHPSSLSRLVAEAIQKGDYAEGVRKASVKVNARVKVLEKYAKSGWSIEADPGKTNSFSEGKEYKYGRADIGPEFYDFGTPKNRMVSRSSAKRMSKAANVVILGTRENGKFSKSKIKEMSDALPATEFSDENLFNARPSEESLKFVFDAGPGEVFAKIMKENLNLRKLFTPKAEEYDEDLSNSEFNKVVSNAFKEDGIEAFNIKTHENVADFGHYRGTFKSPKVIILADPAGVDDIITARALTGERGQYLQKLMEDIGVEDEYLVIKTVPFGMDGASSDEWNSVLKETHEYRVQIFEELLANHRPDFILTDGPAASSTISSIMKKLRKRVKVLKLPRKNNEDEMIKAGKAISKFKGYKGVSSTGEMANIPRSHLSFYARTWEGTSGDRVLMSEGKSYNGMVFAEVVPLWAVKQSFSSIVTKVQDDIEGLLQVIEDNNVRRVGESIPEYLERQ